MVHAQYKFSLNEYETMSNYFENVCESLPPLRVLVVRQHHFLAKFAAQLVVVYGWVTLGRLGRLGRLVSLGHGQTSERLWIFGLFVRSCCQKRKCQLSPGSRIAMDN